MNESRDPTSLEKPEREELSSAEWSTLRRRLTSEAERALWWMRKGTVSADDTAMSALRTYLRQSGEGHLPPPTDPDSLWPILQEQLGRKIGKASATQRYAKNKRAVRYSELTPLVDGRAAESAFTGDAVSPEGIEAYVADALQVLTELIDDEALLQIARLKLECYSTEEIAERTSLSAHQVRRRVSQIRRLLRPND